MADMTLDELRAKYPPEDREEYDGPTHAHPATAPRLEASGPDWSPDGRHIAFTSNFSRPQSSIYVMRGDRRRHEARHHQVADQQRRILVLA
jgi:hypothetical protein